LAARALISETDLDVLSRMPARVSVVRVGISDKPRRMRLAYVWGQRPEGFVAVVRCEDVREPRVSLSGSDASITDDLDDLIALLDVDAEMLRQQRHARQRVSNVDAWPLSAWSPWAPSS